MPDSKDFVRHLNAEIEAAYVNSGSRLGWRFLYSPADVLEGATVAFIGLNPGGSRQDPEHGVFAMEKGSAYRDETWPSTNRLQPEVLALFRRLNAAPEKVLAGNLVPFRSPSWDELPNRQHAVAFGRSLWRQVLDRAKPSIIVTMGSKANDEMARLIGARYVKDLPTGWGDYKARRGRYAGGSWIGLPHLSTFTIMTRPACQPYMDALFKGLAA
ncbi:uracil-DNA glycosylase family protein [uncultured Mameliella sp.]|uniref:uracil-DNA glycosylase family protein n=1 Tax=uncultured Mameliella sp. TaxID=1447087 RepID=UPI00261682C6|nr:uracil-DNA glycosylase family protein [uncultured Mameliella sp.]